MFFSGQRLTLSSEPFFDIGAALIYSLAVFGSLAVASLGGHTVRAGMLLGIVCCSTGACCSTAATVLADVTASFITHIAGGTAYVRSGPGDEYYPTDRLPEGSQVEVYRHDEGGWCAIRPPVSSFSWVSSRHVALGCR